MIHFTLIDRVSGQLQALYTGRFAFSDKCPNRIDSSFRNPDDPLARSIPDSAFQDSGLPVLVAVLHEFFHSLLLARMRSASLLNKLRVLARYAERRSAGCHDPELNVGDLRLYDLFFALQNAFYRRVYEKHEDIVDWLEEQYFASDVDEKKEVFSLRSESWRRLERAAGGGRPGVEHVVADALKRLEDKHFDGESVLEILERQDKELLAAFERIASRPGRYRVPFLPASPKIFLRLVDSRLANRTLDAAARRMVEDFAFIAVERENSGRGEEARHRNIPARGRFNHYHDLAASAPREPMAGRLLLSPRALARAMIQRMPRWIYGLRPEAARDNGLDTDAALMLARVLSQVDEIIFNAGGSNETRDSELKQYDERAAALHEFLLRFAGISEDKKNNKLFELYTLADPLAEVFREPFLAESSISDSKKFNELFRHYAKRAFSSAGGGSSLARLARAWEREAGRILEPPGPGEESFDSVFIRKVRLVFNFFYLHGI